MSNITANMRSLLSEADKAKSLGANPKELANATRSFIAGADAAIDPYIQYLKTQLAQVESMMASLRKASTDVDKQLTAVERQHDAFVKVMRQVSQTDSAEGMAPEVADVVVDMTGVTDDVIVPPQLSKAVSSLFSQLEGAIEQAEYHKSVLAKGMDAAKKLERMG